MRLCFVFLGLFGSWAPRSSRRIIVSSCSLPGILLESYQVRVFCQICVYTHHQGWRHGRVTHGQVVSFILGSLLRWRSLGILNKFRARGPAFSFGTRPCQLCGWSCFVMHLPRAGRYMSGKSSTRSQDSRKPNENPTKRDVRVLMEELLVCVWPYVMRCH